MAATDVTPTPRTPLGELHFNRLLVAYDGTDSADLALSAAVTAARRDRSTITLLTVVPDTMAGVTRWPAPGAPDPQTLQDEADADARRRLDEAVARIPQDIPVAHVPSGRQAVASSS